MPDLKLTEQEKQALTSSLLDIATGKTYEDTVITQTKNNATITSTTETTKPDKDLVLRLLGMDNSYGIGGPQDYC